MEGENKSDIEQNISNSDRRSDDYRGGETDAPSAASPAQQLSLPKKIIQVTFLFAIWCPLRIAVCIFRALCGGTKNFDTFSFVSSEDTSVEIDEEDHKRLTTFYESVHWYEPPIAKSLRRTLTLTCRIGCLLLVWLVISLTLYPLHRILKTATFLGIVHWKWSIFAAFVTLSYPIVFLTIGMYLSGWNKCVSIVFGNSAKAQYYVIDVWAGLSNSLVSLLHVTSVFILWMLYFRVDESLYAGVSTYGTRTLGVLLAASFLWVLKDGLLIRWQTKAVFRKFRTRILMSGFRLYILCHVLDGLASTRLLPCTFQGANMNKNIRHYLDSPAGKRNARQYIVSSKHVSMTQIRVVANLVFSLTKMSTSTSMEDCPTHSDIINAYTERIKKSFSDSDAATTEDLIRRYVKLKSNQVLLEDEMKEEYSTKQLNQIPFDKWVVDAHKNCLSTAYTLSDAEAMVDALNTILTSCLVIIVILVWLLATELASTTVLVVIASPFFALSFVFGDMCKTFFQGFIFVFITHPYNIGDRCIIDGVEVEVKRVNIMTTSCLKIGTNEKMLYPNSALATSMIINLGDKLDPNDVLELILHPSTKKSDLSAMQHHIEIFVDSDEQDKYFEKACEVLVKEMKNGVNIVVHFQHTMDSKDVTYSQFLEKKERQRSILYLEIKDFLDNMGVQIAS